MATFVSKEITQGETFFAEVHVRDTNGVAEDIASVTKSIQCSTGLAEGDFTVTNGSGTGYVEIRATGTATALWTIGVHEIQLWFDYGTAADVEDEIQLKITLTVKAAI